MSLSKARNLLTSTTGIAIAGTLLVLAFVAVLARLGTLGTFIHSAWFAWVLVGAALVLVLSIIFVGLPWYRERQFIRQLGSGYRVAGQQSPQELQAKFNTALREFRSLPQYSGRDDPLYSIPWFLMIGHGQSGKTEAIRAAGCFSTLTSAREGGTQNFEAWVSNSMFLVDTAGRYAIPTDIERDRAEWYRLLRLISYHHGREPLSGIIVAVAADYLASEPDEKLRADASVERERIEDAIKVLSVNCPIYVVVTKCDIVEGFAEFVRALPVRVLNEAVGFIDDSMSGKSFGSSDGHDGPKRLQGGLDTVYQQLRTRAISILNGKVSDPLRRPLFCFPEEFRMLAGRLQVFLEVLSGEDIRYHTPFLRGVFISSTHQQESRQSLLRRRVGIASPAATAAGPPGPHCFLRDLFESIMPRDRGLSSAIRSSAA